MSRAIAHVLFPVAICAASSNVQQAQGALDKGAYKSLDQVRNNLVDDLFERSRGGLSCDGVDADDTTLGKVSTVAVPSAPRSGCTGLQTQTQPHMQPLNRLHGSIGRGAKERPAAYGYGADVMDRPQYGAPTGRGTGRGSSRGYGRGYGKGKGGGKPSDFDQGEYVTGGAGWGLKEGEDPFAKALHDQEEGDKAFGTSGINFDAYDDIPVEASGSDVPAGITSFSDIELPQSLVANIDRCKFTKPTPVQKHSLPIAKAGRDLMACAQTGSGKTAGFMFPIIARLLETPRPPRAQGRFHTPRALVIAPTRELALQIHEEGNKFAYRTGLSIRAIYGGAPARAQMSELSRYGVDILVATPGRLEDFIDRGLISLSQVQYLCLDEADRMLDMGFEPAIREIVERRDMPATGQRQTMMFSATFPEEIQDLAADFLHNYIFLTVGRVGSSTDLITQKVEYTYPFDKRDKLVQTLREGPGLQIVFTNTKRVAGELEYDLWGQGIRACSIHGDKDQRGREKALSAFKSGERRVLIATDVAARGLDIPHVEKVVNYDLPTNIDDYVHRIGRTGRAGKKGVAVAFFTDENNALARDLVETMEESKQEVPDWLRSISPPRKGKSRSGRFGGRDFRKSYGGQSQGYRRPPQGGRYGGGDFRRNDQRRAGQYGGRDRNQWE